MSVSARCFNEAGNRLHLLLFLAMLLGAGLAYPYATLQVAAEPAQVVAGLVDYPDGNPNLIYQTKLWTIWHQTLAVLLRLGVSEAVCSSLLTMLAGAAYATAFALIGYVLTRSVLLALAIVPFALMLPLAPWGVQYPLSFIDSTHTYGVLGLAGSILVLGLLVNKYHASALLLAGLMPAIHPSLGVWLCFNLCLAAIFDLRHTLHILKRYWWWLAAGITLSVLSLIWQLAFIARVPTVDPLQKAQFLEIYLRHWDYHRRPIDFTSNSILLLCAEALLIGGWLRFRRWQLSWRQAFLLRFTLIAILSGLLSCLLVVLFPFKVPDLLLILMPNRALNAALAIAIPLVISLIWISRPIFWGYLSLIVVGLGMFLLHLPFPLALAGGGLVLLLLPKHRDSSVLLRLAFLAGGGLLYWFGITALFHRSLGRSLSLSLNMVAIAVICIAIICLFHGQLDAWIRKLLPVPAKLVSYLKRVDRRRQPLGLARHAFVWIALGLLIVTAAFRLATSAPDSVERRNRLADWRTDTFLAAVSRQDGMVVVAPGYAQLQLRTRRPVLLDVASLDGLPYAIEGAPLANEMLREIYGVDLLDPRHWDTHFGMLNEEPTRSQWATRTPAEWQRLADSFDFQLVFAHSRWRIQLQPVAQSHYYTLYRVRP